MGAISYSNLHGDSSLPHGLFTADGTTESSNENLIISGDEWDATHYVISPCFYIRLHATTWGMTAKSNVTCYAYAYDPVSKSWISVTSWSSGQASGFNSSKDASRGHNCSTDLGYNWIHLWKFRFVWSTASGSNKGHYDYCCFYPSYEMSSSYWDTACKYKRGNSSYGTKPIVGIEPMMITVSSSYSSLTRKSNYMYQYYAPSEAYIIDRFVDTNNYIFRDPTCTGTLLNGSGSVLSSYKNYKNIAWCA